MEGFITCSVLGLVMLGLLAFGLVIWQGARLRSLQTAVRTLAQRVAVLEKRPAPVSAVPQSTPEVSPRPVAIPPPLPVAPASPNPVRPAIDWEAFMGVKLFAWVGGFVLFLGVVFLVKYSFQNNLISPVMRISLGALIGLGLIGGGWFAALRKYQASGQSLCATGVLVLYADIFAAHAFYNLLGLPLTFALMSAITLAAFLLAVILDAQVVGVLGLVGGFVTPPLLTSAVDNPLFLFGYVALLNFGIAAVVLRKKWDYLLLLAAFGTIAMEFAWGPSGNKDTGSAWLGFYIFLGLQLQFLLIALLRQRQEPVERWSTPAALIVGWASLGFGFWLLAHGALAGRSAFFFGFVFLADIGLLALALGRKQRASFLTTAGVAVALTLTWSLELGWHSSRFSSGSALETLGWYLAFLFLFAGYPFFERRRAVAGPLADTSIVSAVPWAIGALAGMLHFWLVYELVEASYPACRNGFLPALFILPYAFGVFYLIRRCGVVPASGDARLAWQGGAALFFVSLIFPIQFEREWITLGWAVEGLALLVLFRSVPHSGLRLVGAGLLGIAFTRLALNPAVLEYHRRAPVPIWNWYLYAYGIACLCFFAGARAVQSFRETLMGRVIPRTLYAQGAILLFVLLNIEIADYFSVGPTLTFSFEGNFARDMTYSIAWALFAFALLLIGMRQRTKWVRYAGAGLLLITLAKLFLHDFPNLGPLYRIGATVGVAIVLIVASFVYQRFLRPKK